MLWVVWWWYVVMLEELVFLENLLAETDLILSTRLYTSSYEQSQGVPKEKHIESKSPNDFGLMAP